jgi:hypothetical protein
MLEIDWSSRFSSFFGMVRIRIACKDPSKVPAKRLFEMENNFYVIHFKVESASSSSYDEGNDSGKDDDNGNNADESGMEEIQHDSEPKYMGANRGNGHENFASGHGLDGTVRSGSRSNGSKKAGTWASLF